MIMSPRYRQSLVLCAAASVFAVPAAAQQDSAALLPPIVVSAHHHPVPREVLTSRVTVLDGEALRARGITLVSEALRTVPALHVVESGSFGGATSVFLRGGESDYVRVLVDGVPVNEPGGSYNFAHLTTANVERIEVVRGPASVVYGSDAVTGVINVITRAGGGSSVSSGVRGGTFGTLEIDASAAGGGDRAGYGLEVRRFTSDGTLPFNNGYRNTSAAARLRVGTDARTAVAVTARYTDATYHFPTDGAGLLVDSNQYTASETLSLGVRVTRRVAPWIRARVQLDMHEIATLFDDQPDGPGDTVGFSTFRSDASLRRRRADGRVVLTPGTVTVISAGMEFEQEWQRTDRDRSRHNRAVYAQVVAGPVRGLSGTAGVRVDHNEGFGTFVTFRTGAAYRVPGAGTRLHVSAGTSFKEPTFFETFDDVFSIGNPELDPERSRSVEAGLEQPLAGGRLVLAATLFDQHFTDLIQYTFAPPAASDPNYFNVAAADARGVEVEVTGAPLPGLELSGSYTYLETAATDSGFDAGQDAAFVVGERLLRRPTHSAALHASVQPTPWLVASARLHHVGTRDDRDFSTFPARRVSLRPYTTISASLHTDVLEPRGSRPGLTLTARVENLLDARFQDIAGFPARGRTVLVGARIGF